MALQPHVNSISSSCYYKVKNTEMTVRRLFMHLNYANIPTQPIFSRMCKIVLLGR